MTRITMTRTARRSRRRRNDGAGADGRAHPRCRGFVVLLRKRLAADGSPAWVKQHCTRGGKLEGFGVVAVHDGIGAGGYTVQAALGACCPAVVGAGAVVVGFDDGVAGEEDLV